MNAQDSTVRGLGERSGDDRFAEGLIMLEAAPHGSAVYHARHALNHFFRRVQKRSDVFIANNLLLIHQDGEAEIRLGPDLLVAFGLSEEPVSSYRISDQGKPPDWVLEVTSPSTKTRDRTVKKDQYAAMGVREFWILELADRHREAQLQGFRLERGQYMGLAPLGEDGPITSRSEVLGLDLWLDGELLRVRDSQTGAAALAGRAEEAITLDAATKRQTDMQRGRKTDTRRHKTEANRQTESNTRRATETYLLEAEGAERNEDKALRDAEARVAELEARIQILEASHPWNKANRKA